MPALRKTLLALLALLTLALAALAINFFARLTKVTPTPDAAFHWPYYLYTPARVSEPAHLLVLPNNSGGVDDDPRHHDRLALFTTFLGHLIFSDLRTPILVPAFPRPESDWRVYTHALDRDCLTTTLPELRRLDLQLDAMIEDASTRLAQKGRTVDRKVLLMGFSASGMFANRFTVLHPDRVLAAAIGSPGGWPIAPLDEWQGQTLRYPVGVADLASLTGAPFDLETFRSVPLFFFIGDQDENDSVPYHDSYDDEDRSLVFHLFGPTPVSRWGIAEELYAAAGAQADFRLYPNLGHSPSLQTIRDVHSFFNQALGR